VKSSTCQFLLTDDNSRLRAALRLMLETHLKIELIGEATDGDLLLPR
jgi:hypothetical protein